jgi:hypothetical protein
MSCVLRVSSSDNDLTPFVAKSQLPIYESYRRGEVCTIGRKERAHKNFGFKCDVSKREFSDLPGQIGDALVFLQRHEAELRQLRAEYKIDDLRLDFACWLRIGDTTITQSDYFPPSLLSIAGNLGVGIEFSLYPKPQEEEPNQPPEPTPPAGAAHL